MSGTVWWSEEGWIPTFLHITTRVWGHKHRKSTVIFWNRNNTSMRMLWLPSLVIYIKHISRLYPNDTLSYRMIYDESPMQAILYQFQTDMPLYEIPTQIAKFMRPTRGPPGSCRLQMGPMLAPWTCYQGRCPRCNKPGGKPCEHHTRGLEHWGLTQRISLCYIFI